MRDFQTLKVAAACALAASIVTCAAQSATAAGKYIPADEAAKADEGKRQLEKSQQTEGKRIAEVVLAPQPLNPEKPRQLQVVHEASLGLQSVINDRTERSARGVILYRSTNDPQARQEAKDGIMKLLTERDRVRNQQKPLNEFIQGNVPAVPPGHKIDVPPFENPVRSRPMPPLQFGESPAYQQAVAISQTLKELNAPGGIERDMSNPFRLSSKTEGLLQRLNQDYSGAVANDPSVALRDARGREGEILTQLAALDQRITAHNDREPTPPKIPDVVNTVEEQRYWIRIGEDYANNVAAPYNREAAQLNGEEADLHQKLQVVRDEMRDLRNRR